MSPPALRSSITKSRPGAPSSMGILPASGVRALPEHDVYCTRFGYSIRSRVFLVSIFTIPINCSFGSIPSITTGTASWPKGTNQDQARERSVYWQGGYPSDSAAARIPSATAARRRYSSFASVACSLLAMEPKSVSEDMSFKTSIDDPMSLGRDTPARWLSTIVVAAKSNRPRSTGSRR